MQYILASLDRAQFQPCLAVFKLTGREREVVPPDVPIYDLSVSLHPATFFMVLKLAKLLREARPDRVLSFMWSINIVALLAAGLAGLKAPVVVSERTHPGRSILRYSFIPLRRFMIKWLYPAAGKIIAVSRSVAANLTEEYNVPADKISVIGNGAPVALIEEKKSVERKVFCEKPYIAAAGGLNSTKNFQLLIRAFSTLAAKNNALKLLIMGEGDERPVLEALIERLNLQGKVFLPGAVNNPYPYMAGAEVFVLTSRFEGFPNVILEAMACRVPVVATRCSSAVEETIKDGETGIMIPENDEAALVTALERLLADPGLRAGMSEKAYQKVKSEFDLKVMVKRYEDILQ